MCWTEIKDNVNVQIADKDLKVYKVVSNANKQSCKSIIMGFDYTVNTPYYIPTIRYEVFGFKYKVVNIKKAYHSFTGIRFICDSSFYNRAIRSKGMLVGKRRISVPFENDSYIATFIIPKGATYIINAQGAVVSDTIIYTGKYIKL